MHVSNLHAPTSKKPAVSAEEDRRDCRLLRALVVLVLALACASALALNLVDPDLWGHIRYAEDWLASGELPRNASYSFTATEHRWINHELLAELTLALGYRQLGIDGLLVVKCLLGMVIVGLMIGTAVRRGIPMLAAWVMMLLVCVNLHPFFLLRPQILSFLLLCMVLAALEYGFFEWERNQTVRWRALWALPALFALWANTHGAFVAGLGIVGILLVGQMIELIVRQRAIGNDFALLGLLGTSCAAATLLNPYGVELHRWLWMALSQPRPEIAEWLAPSPSNIVFWPWIALLVIGLFSIVASSQRRNWVKISILVVVAWQAALHVRHIALLALLCGFWLPEHMYSAFSKLRLPKIAWIEILRKSVAIRKIAIIGMLLVMSWMSLRLDRQMNGMQVSRNRYPLDAVQFMADRGLRGKLVVSFNWAQYVIAALSPEVQVAFDGRFRTCYPQQVIDMNFDFLLGDSEGRRFRSTASGAIEGSRVLEYCSPDLVLIDRRYENAVAVMEEKSSDWSLLYRDRVAEIWGRHERYDKLASPHYFPLKLRVLDPRSRDGSVSWPALPAFEKRQKIASQNSSLGHLGG